MLEVNGIWPSGYCAVWKHLSLALVQHISEYDDVDYEDDGNGDDEYDDNDDYDGKKKIMMATMVTTTTTLITMMLMSSSISDVRWSG